MVENIDGSFLIWNKTIWMSEFYDGSTEVSIRILSFYRSLLLWKYEKKWNSNEHAPEALRAIKQLYKFWLLTKNAEKEILFPNFYRSTSLSKKCPNVLFLLLAFLRIYISFWAAVF